MFDVKKYKMVLNKIKEDGSFNGKAVKTKEDIYKELATILNYEHGTVKGWTRPTSTGPGAIDTVRKLEEALGINAYSLDKESEKGEIEEMKNIILSDVNKNAVFKVYELMKDYLHDEEMENEDCFSYMWREVEKYRILIPKELFKKISDFIDSNLAPIVYESEKTYDSCYTDEIGFWNKDGIWEVETEEKAKQMCMNFILKNIEIEESLDEFAMKELHPYLV